MIFIKQRHTNTYVLRSGSREEMDAVIKRPPQSSSFSPLPIEPSVFFSPPRIEQCVQFAFEVADARVSPVGGANTSYWSHARTRCCSVCRTRNRGPRRRVFSGSRAVGITRPVRLPLPAFFLATNSRAITFFLLLLHQFCNLTRYSVVSGRAKSTATSVFRHRTRLWCARCR